MTEITSSRLKWFTISESVIMRVALCGVQFKFNFRIKRYNYFREKGESGKNFEWWNIRTLEKTPRRRLGNHKSNLVFLCSNYISSALHPCLRLSRKHFSRSFVRSSKKFPNMWTHKTVSNLHGLLQRSLSICMCEKFVRIFWLTIAILQAAEEKKKHTHKFQSL